MILSTSNLYLETYQRHNAKYLNLFNNKQFDDIFVSYHHTDGHIYYVLSPLRARDTFQQVVDILFDIPSHLLYFSDFHPFYQLADGQLPSNFKKYDDSLNLHTGYNFYIRKEDFVDDYFLSFDMPQSSFLN